MTTLFSLARATLFRMDAESAHGLTLTALELARRCGTLGLLSGAVPPRPVTVAGIRFPNPVGLAAGCDKNGVAIRAFARLGFGFIEVGTVTPKPQPGNPRPRMFRLPEHQAVINRLGFNNEGIDVLVRNVERAAFKGVLGINLGKNKDTPNAAAIDDYRFGLERVYPLASYVTINISSPNTVGLRELQQADALRRLLHELKDTQQRLAGRYRRVVPLFVKLAPDLDEAGLNDSAQAVLDAGIEGAILGNTTLERGLVAGHALAGESGGLSGAPLKARADAVLQAFRARVGNRLALIGVGGITNGADARDKQLAGADLVQFYTGLVYRGPALIGDCVRAWQAS